MRVRSSAQVLGVLLLLLLLGGAQAAAGALRTTTGPGFARYQEICDIIRDGAAGTPVTDGTDVLGDAEAAEIGESGTPGVGTPLVEVLEGTDPGEIAVGGTPDPGASIPDVTDVLGDDNMLGPDDEGFLCQDIDDDPAFEIGIDEDNDGVLDEDEVLGEDLNEDQALTQDELDPAVARPGGTETAGGFTQFAGEDHVFDASDEGFLRENIDDDEASEIGFDEDASGTLEEHEVLGEDLNNDEALTEDEFGV